mgnify:CR=1 FL=1
MITDVDDYFVSGCGRCERFATPDCSTRRWASGLKALRRICIDAGLVETVKWGHPCYMHAGRNIAIIGAFRDDFRLSFFNAALMSDPEGILEKQGPNTRHPDMIRFASNAAVAARRNLLRAYLAEAMALALAGKKPPKDQEELALPDELVDALDGDPDLAVAFRALTPGRRKSYVINLRAAKATATRRLRIERFRERILAGKGVNDR